MSASMQICRRAVLAGGAVTMLGSIGLTKAKGQASASRELRFDNVRFRHRWSRAGQHEFTPEGDGDLSRWTDMVTINRHATVHNGDQLADVANRVAENYKRNGRLIRTSSRRAGPNQVVEHLAVVMFVRPEFIEVAFTRFMLADGAGFAVTYSKRFHGQAAGQRMSDWLLANGARTEAVLLAWADPKALADAT